MKTLRVNSAVSERLRVFMDSDLFATRSLDAKSAYWRHHARQLQANVAGNVVKVAGDSGFSVPQESSIVKRIVHDITRVVSQPAKAANWLTHQVTSRFKTPRMMSYERALDEVMRHAAVSDPDYSPFRVNHLNLGEGVFTSTKSLKKHYQDWSGYKVTPNIIAQYYCQNILRGCISPDQVNTVLEIGAGNGNFSSILYHDWAPIRNVGSSDPVS